MRLLKPGGQALIYVWAFEQEYNKQRSKYLKEQDKEKYSMKNSTSQDSRDLQESSCGLSDVKLSIHTNRTAFKIQDLLVPWHLKDNKTLKGEYSGGILVDKMKVDNKASSGHVNRSDCKPGPHFKMSLGISSEPQNSPGGKTESTSVPVYHRYYHLFQHGELEQLCAQITGVKVQSRYHDQGNWCVILEKTA